MNTLLVRRGPRGGCVCRGGHNFDILTGTDLLSSRGQQALWHYLETARPRIVIMAPPCRGLKGWAALNAIIHRAGWLRSLRLSVPFGKLCGRVAKRQLSVGAHFIVEQPAGSKLFQLREWMEISRRPSIVWVRAGQCVAGLRGHRTGMSIKKRTECWTSCEALIRPLWQFQCHGRQRRAHLGITDPTQRAEVWPRALCAAIAEGCATVLRDSHLAQVSLHHLRKYLMRLYIQQLHSPPTKF